MAAAVLLTDQQQAIVNHTYGPALVFAVAGAGKTTTMVQRIVRLVRAGLFAPEQILATSFNKAANEEILAKLKPQAGCQRVQVKTLHALGYQIIREAQRAGRLRHLRANGAQESVEALDRQLLYKTLAVARQKRVRYAEELMRFDHDDFLTYVGACKGNLHYADLHAAQLPASARTVAQQARAPSGLAWYLDFYRLYEELRRSEGLLTFDDMLMTGWEVLIRHPEMLADLRRQHQCVLVDEFQDINLAQSEILDLLTAPQRNYMAIGDDDQTIYEWRGASPRFILEFAQRYQAPVYYMTDNFRGKAPHLALANRVIERNQVRQPKTIGLTQGFEGHAYLHLLDNAEALGQQIGDEIITSLGKGYTAKDVAILVRIYAQTPPIEQALIQRAIPYEVVGGEPFYERAEVRLLLDYCHVAQMEQLLHKGAPPNQEQLHAFKRAWFNIYNQPTRYLSRALAEKINEFVTRERLPVSRALVAASHDAPDRLARMLHKLADDLKWLAQALAPGRNGAPAAKEVLQQLEHRLQYRTYLKQSSAFPETGSAKAAGIAAFIDFAQGKGNLEQFMRHLETLSAARQHLPRGAAQSAVAITTIYRAKGLEWPLVFVPNCNAGALPYERMASLEEERRLLYVAITRARQTLYLSALRNQPLSPFLEEARAIQTLESVEAIQRALTQAPQSWRMEEMVGLALESQRLHLGDYFRYWWKAPVEHKQRIASLALRILSSIEQHGLREKFGLHQADSDLWRALLEARE
jgi:DNA helicase-2/ATP-dependent DNA helicase PcrA